MTKHKLGIIFCIIFCTTLIVSNIIGSKITTILFIDLPASILVFPITYIINDVFSEVYGFKRAKEVIMVGFAMNLLLAVVLQLAIWLPTSKSYPYGNEFTLILGNSTKMLIASFASYTTGSIVNSFIMEKMRTRKAFNDNLLYRCIASTFVGVAFDSSIFITIAFFGTVPAGIIISMIIAQTVMKTLYEFILYPATKKVINYAYALPE